MSKVIEKKLALVTGGGSGIGLAIAEKFVRNGIHTLIVGRNQGKLDAARLSLGDLCHPYCLDLNDLASIPKFIQQITEEHGPVETLVNNAGINMKKDLIDTSDEDFERILHTNLMSVFTMTREVIKIMLRSGKGNIINISSMASQYGLPKVIAYTASKSAIEGMTRGMAVELSPKGIRVNCIAPGFIATDMSAKALNSDAERKQKVMSRTPLGYLGDPSDIGETALFLASEGARYITGIVIPVDGGNSVGF